MPLCVLGAAGAMVMDLVVVGFLPGAAEWESEVVLDITGRSQGPRGAAEKGGWWRVGLWQYGLPWGLVRRAGASGQVAGAFFAVA